MRTHEIIAWALRAIDQAKAGQPYEDSRVEFKSIWIEPREAARHIAGHANAARGEPILWLMGVTPAGEVPGVPAMELANWYPQLKSFFDETSPELTDVNISVGDVTVVALLWNTEPAPFVYKTGRGDSPREVLFRHGTRNDAATRSQLIRILSPLVKRPVLEMVSGGVRITRVLIEPSKQFAFDCEVSCLFFLIQPQDQHSVLVRHHTSVYIVTDSGPLTMDKCSFRLPEIRNSARLVTITGSSEVFLLSGGMVDVPAERDLPASVSVKIEVEIPGVDSLVSTRIDFTLSESTNHERAWTAHHRRNGEPSSFLPGPPSSPES